MTLKPKPNYPNGSIQKNQDWKKHVKFGQMWRISSLFSSIAIAWFIMNSCHKVVRSIINTTLKLWADCIHNCLLQPYSQDYGLFSPTTHIVWVNFIREWRDLQFNVDSKQQIFEKLFHGRFRFICSQSFCQKSAERKSQKIYFFLLRFDAWSRIRTRALRVASQHTNY